MLWRGNGTEARPGLGRGEGNRMHILVRQWRENVNYFRDKWCFLICFGCFVLVFALEKTKTLSCYPFKTYFLFPTTYSLFQISMSYFLSGLIIHSFFFHQTFNQRKMINYQFHFLLQVATKAHCKGECDQHGSEWPAAVPTILSGAHSQRSTSQRESPLEEADLCLLGIQSWVKWINRINCFFMRENYTISKIKNV